MRPMSMTGPRQSRSSGFSYIWRFLVYNCLFALLPLIIVRLIRLLSDMRAGHSEGAPEWLFFALMVSVTALADLTDESALSAGSVLAQVGKAVLMLVAIMAAVFYGINQYDAMGGSATTAFRQNAGALALWLAVASFVPSLAVEILLARIRAENDG